MEGFRRLRIILHYMTDSVAARMSFAGAEGGLQIRRRLASQQFDSAFPAFLLARHRAEPLFLAAIADQSILLRTKEQLFHDVIFIL